MKVLIINGPNLNLLGSREPGVYGTLSMADTLAALRRGRPDDTVDFFQSNHEGAIIDRLHAADTEGYDGVVLNAGAYTHTSLAIADAVRSISLPVIEVHISNIWARETERHRSLISPAAAGVIAGLGHDVYRLALCALENMQR